APHLCRRTTAPNSLRPSSNARRALHAGAPSGGNARHRTSRRCRALAKEDFVFRPDEVSAVPINIKRGEVLEYLRNIGEGAFEVRIRGKRYRADQDLFGHVLDVPGQNFIEENWVALNCVNGKRAFIYLPDLGLNSTKTRVSGINDIGPGLIKYGK